MSRGEILAMLGSARVCVAGRGRAGTSAARALADLGAHVTVADRAEGTDRVLPPGTELVVTSPGWRPDQPLLVAAAAAGVPVWGDVELAWRLRRTGALWLGVTGTNGKTTTVQMLESILRAAGLRAVACGNIGLPVLDAVLADEPYDVLAVEVSSFQLHWMQTVEFHAAAVLNIAPDHLDWHGSMAAYAAAKAAIWRGSPVAVFNADDPGVAALAAGRSPSVGVTLGEPVDGQVGVVGGTTGGWVVSRASICSDPPGGSEHMDGGGGTPRGALLGAAVPGGAAPLPVGAAATAGTRLAAVADIRPPAPHNVANALAAAALACAAGAPAAAVGAGLRSFVPGGHRIATVGERRGVTYVDDSKATNPHAAAASLAAFGRVVWIAGGLATGATFDDVVAGARGRLRAAVLMGRDRDLVAQALARHAPEIPVVEVDRTDTKAMDDAVRAAAGLAEPGDTVLLAPACASMDMFDDYAARGEAFAAAVERLAP